MYGGEILHADPYNIGHVCVGQGHHW